MTPSGAGLALTEGTLLIPVPPQFNFWRAAFSHGWCDLPPFSYDRDQQHLFRFLKLSDGTLVDCRTESAPGSILVTTRSRRPLSQGQRIEVVDILRICFRLDEDFSAFHKEARRHPEYRWINRSGAGPLLRAPTVFEDTVKMICTTNCTWALTRIMVKGLVESFGRPLGDSYKTFPSPDDIAGSTERFLRVECKTGYRAPYILQLAQRIVAGELSVDEWRTSPLSTQELFAEMRKVKGVGPYAAGNLLKLVGRYDELGLDSWVRAQYARLHTRGHRVKDSTIERRYEHLGRWKGLFFWLEMTRDWHDEKFKTPLTP